jgi:electron transfer flavoprotein alpha subunit
MSSDIFVLVEHLEDKVGEVAYELLGKGRELATASGGSLVAVLLGSGVRGLADELGAADRVLVVDDPAFAGYTPEAYKRALGALAKVRGPRVLLIANTAVGMDQAAGLSAELGWPLVAYARNVSLTDGALTAVSQIYGGKILAEAKVSADHAIVSLLAGASPAEKGKVAGSPAIEEVAAPESLSGLRTRFVRLILPEAGDVDITKEPILVSVGRGIGSQDNISLVQELADALGAAVSSSRPIVDQGWLPKTRQVGKSGMTVKPKLYIAVGISGAPEHLEGMRSAATIVAINTDPQAPIFDVAHYGATADLFDVLPLLTEKIKTARGQA